MYVLAVFLLTEAVHAAPAPVGDAPEKIAAIRKLGGKVETRALGRATVVITVDLSDRPVTDAGLKLLAGLDHLRELYLAEVHRDSKITEAAVAALRRAGPGSRPTGTSTSPGRDR